MIASYQWLPDRQLVRVTFQERLEFKQNLYDQFFTGRSTAVDEKTGTWFWVDCELGEWEKYIVFVWGVLIGQPFMQSGAADVWMEYMRFKEFRARLERDVFYKPSAGFAA